MQRTVGACSLVIAASPCVKIQHPIAVIPEIRAAINSAILAGFITLTIVASEYLSRTDGMRRPVSGRDAVRSQVINALEAQEIKETGNEKD